MKVLLTPKDNFFKLDFGDAFLTKEGYLAIKTDYNQCIIYVAATDKWRSCTIPRPYTRKGDYDVSKLDVELKIKGTAWEFFKSPERFGETEAEKYHRTLIFLAQLYYNFKDKVHDFEFGETINSYVTEIGEEETFREILRNVEESGK